MMKFSNFDSELEPSGPAHHRPDAYRGVLYTWGVNTKYGKPILEPHYMVTDSKELIWDMEPGETVYYLEVTNPMLNIIVDWYESHSSGNMGEVLDILLGDEEIPHVHVYVCE